MQTEPAGTFGAFVELDENRFALSIAKKIANFSQTLPSVVLFIGESGTGKTHLLRAIENNVAEQVPTRKVARVSSSDFMIDHIRSIRFNKQEEFRKKYCEIDLLLFDDAQYLNRRENTSAEVLRTLDALSERGSRVVFSATSTLSDLLIRPLADRLSGGVAASIEPPSLESRSVLLRYFCGKAGIYLDQKTFDFILQHRMTSVRCIEGAVETLRSIDDKAFSAIELATAKSILKSFLKGVATESGIET